MDNRVTLLVEKHLPTMTIGDKKTIPFKPTTKQVQLAEKSLEKFIKSKYPVLFKKYSSYYRQYAGFEVEGNSKIIQGNFLCKVQDDKWRKEWVVAVDGGDCYFHFFFDIEKSKITEFVISGIACEG